MTLNLANLTPKVGAPMPKSERGRTAEPVPANILDAVKQTYSLPDGQGGSFRVPNGDKNDAGKDTNVILVVGQLRKAANQLGYGLSVKIMEPTKTTTEVLFRAKAKSARTRRTKEQIAHDNLVAEWTDYLTENDITELPARENDIYGSDEDYAAAVEAFDDLASAEVAETES